MSLELLELLQLIALRQATEHISGTTIDNNPETNLKMTCWFIIFGNV